MNLETLSLLRLWPMCWHDVDRSEMSKVCINKWHSDLLIHISWPVTIVCYPRRCRISPCCQRAGRSILRSSVRFQQNFRKPRIQICMDLTYTDPQVRVLNYCKSNKSNCQSISFGFILWVITRQKRKESMVKFHAGSSILLSLRLKTPVSPIGELATIPRRLGNFDSLEGFLSFFLSLIDSCVSNTQLNHWSQRVQSTRLILSFFPPFFYPFHFCFGCVCACMCVYLHKYVRAYLAIPCVSANDNVKQIQ